MNLHRISIKHFMKVGYVCFRVVFLFIIIQKCVANFQNNPKKKILKYLKFTYVQSKQLINVSLNFPSNFSCILACYQTYKDVSCISG